MAAQERNQACATWTGDLDAVKGKLILAGSSNTFSILLGALPERVALFPGSPSYVDIPACLPEIMAIPAIQFTQAAGPGFIEKLLCCENAGIDSKNALAYRK